MPAHTKPTQASRILKFLKDRGTRGVYNHEFFVMKPPILRGGARIHELRKEGHRIEITSKGRGVFLYRLVSSEEGVSYKSTPSSLGSKEPNRPANTGLVQDQKGISPSDVIDQPIGQLLLVKQLNLL